MFLRGLLYYKICYIVIYAKKLNIGRDKRNNINEIKLVEKVEL